MRGIDNSTSFHPARILHESCLVRIQVRHPLCRRIALHHPIRTHVIRQRSFLRLQSRPYHFMWVRRYGRRHLRHSAAYQNLLRRQRFPGVARCNKSTKRVRSAISPKIIMTKATDQSTSSVFHTKEIVPRHVEFPTDWEADLGKMR